LKKAVTYGVLFLLALAFVATCTAGAQLAATSFGFPTIVQTGETTAFNQDTAVATDNEAFSLAFPAGGFGFPTISQTVVQTQALTHTDFAQTSETAAFAYPFVGVGAAGFPGLGFGF